MKRRSLKSKQYFSFWSSAKHRKGFSKINDSVKSSLQKWIISHPHVIQYAITNDYITVKFDDGNGGVKTEIRQEVLLQVSVHELHILGGFHDNFPRFALWGDLILSECKNKFCNCLSQPGQKQELGLLFSTNMPE